MKKSASALFFNDVASLMRNEEMMYLPKGKYCGIPYGDD